MDFQRINSVISTEIVQDANVVVVGTGGAKTLLLMLICSGVRNFRLVDFEIVEPSNIARQGHVPQHMQRPKVEAAAAEMQRMASDAHIETYPLDVTTLSETEAAAIFEGASVVIAATDNLAAQLRINELAIEYQVPCYTAGLYQGAGGGEIFRWWPGAMACYGCMFHQRIKRLAEQSTATGTDRQRMAASSNGATINEVVYNDSIVAQLVIAELTAGSDNRYGKMIEQLGDRQLLVSKIHHDWILPSGVDFVRRELGVADDCDAFFGFNSVALRPELETLPSCSVCDVHRPQAAPVVAATDPMLTSNTGSTQTVF